MAIDLSEYPSMNPSPKEMNRAKVVEVALEILKAAASAGVIVGAEGLRPPEPLIVEGEIAENKTKLKEIKKKFSEVDQFTGNINFNKDEFKTLHNLITKGTFKNLFNPVKQYADWIEEALEIKAE